MVLTTDQERLKNLLIETITVLCKNGLNFQSEFSVDALIGITLDQKDVFLVTIKETVKSVISSEVGNEQFSTAILRSDAPDADFHENNHHQNSINCQFGLDIASAVKNDDFGSKLVPESVPEARNGTSCVGKTFCGSMSPSTSDNCPLVVNIASPLSDDNICILEDIIPSVSSQKGCAAMDSLQLEPPRKRQCKTSCSLKINDNSNAISQEAVIQDLTSPCKLEPLEVINLENSPEHFGTQDNRNFLYDAVYGNEVNATLDPMFLNWYSQPTPSNPPAVPGCSSWLNSSVFASRNVRNNDQVVELVPGSEVYISANLFAEIEQEQNLKGSRLVRRLVYEIFPDEQLLATSSCLGKGYQCARQGLDQHKIDTIKAFVNYKCPMMKERDVVQTINWICGNTRKRLRDRVKRLSQECCTSLETG